jgi:hypothetical protein
MISLPRVSSANGPVAPGSILSLSGLKVDPLAWVGAIDDETHILVIGGCGPGMACASLRAGTAPVTHLFSHERPKAGSASLVIVPRIPSLDWLATALPSIRRALVANGRLVIRGGIQFNFEVEARRMLALHGFSSIRARRIAEGQVLVAEIQPRGGHRAV